jgi:hypothetical protein
MSGEHTERRLPNEASEMRGVRGFLFGRREYAYPALRWLSRPLFRLAWIPFLVLVLSDYHSNAAFIAFITLALVSLAADGINYFMMRARRRRPA